MNSDLYFFESGFENATGHQIRIEGHDPNYLVHITDAISKKNRTLKGFYWKHLTTQTIGRLIAVFNKRRSSELVVFLIPFVNYNLSQVLHEVGVNYIDASGNCRIYDGSELALRIVGLKANPNLSKTKPDWMGESGVRLVYQFLSDPDGVNRKYKELSARAGVSLGSISNTMHSLTSEGFVIQKGADYYITRRDELTARWVDVFNRNWRPKYTRYYKSSTPVGGKPLPDGMYWGGEFGASLLVKDTPAPFASAMYTVLSHSDLIRTFKLRPEVHYGDVTVTMPPFVRALNPFGPSAHPLLVYADLMLSPNSRWHEVANSIRIRHLRDT